MVQFTAIPSDLKPLIVSVSQFTRLLYICPGVYLSLHGTVIPNHGHVMVSRIGYSDSTGLLCHTDRPSPTGSRSSGGDWFSPDGTRVDGSNVVGLKRNREPMIVRLLRDDALIEDEGMYWCSVLDDSDIHHRVYVGLYNDGGGNQ